MKKKTETTFVNLQKINLLNYLKQLYLEIRTLIQKTKSTLTKRPSKEEAKVLRDIGNNKPYEEHPST